VARLERLADEAIRWEADILHTHLLEKEELAILSARGLPVAAAIHNVRPAGRSDRSLGAADAALLIACAKAVEADLRQAAIPVPARTTSGTGSDPRRDRSARAVLRERACCGRGSA